MRLLLIVFCFFITLSINVFGINLPIESVEYNKDYHFEEKRWFPMRKKPISLKGIFTLYKNNSFQILYKEPKEQVIRLNKDGHLVIVNEETKKSKKSKNTYLPKIIMSLLKNDKRYIDKVYIIKQADAENGRDSYSLKSRMNNKHIPDLKVSLNTAGQLAEISMKQSGVKIQIALITNDE